MFEFVDDIESRILALQQKYSNAVSEFQTLLLNYQKLKTEHQNLLERNQEAYMRLEKLLENLPAEISDSIQSLSDSETP